MAYEIKTFKDNQVTAKVLKDDHLTIVSRGNTYQDLFKIASIKEAWDFKNRMNKSFVSSLTITCLIAQRSDRRFGEGESFDLKIITDFINQLNFDQVKIFHPHSDTSIALLQNA